MEKKYNMAFSETLEILYKSEPKILNKIPKKLLEFLEENKDNTYNSDIIFKENWIKKLRPETCSIIALIYKKYIATEEEKRNFIKFQKEKSIVLEEELRKKYNYDDMFKRDSSNNENIIKEENTENNKELKIYKKSFFREIINKILIFLKIK